jgi:hypothetical protein
MLQGPLNEHFYHIFSVNFIFILSFKVKSNTYSSNVKGIAIKTLRILESLETKKWRQHMTKDEFLVSNLESTTKIF